MESEKQTCDISKCAAARSFSVTSSFDWLSFFIWVNDLFVCEKNSQQMRFSKTTKMSTRDNSNLVSNVLLCVFQVNQVSSRND